MNKCSNRMIDINSKRIIKFIITDLLFLASEPFHLVRHPNLLVHFYGLSAFSISKSKIAGSFRTDNLYCIFVKNELQQKNKIEIYSKSFLRKYFLFFSINKKISRKIK